MENSNVWNMKQTTAPNAAHSFPKNQAHVAVNARAVTKKMETGFSVLHGATEKVPV